MIAVRFIGPAGVIGAQGRAGDRLLDVAQAAGQPLEGTCGGAIACATCHVLVDAAHFGRLPPPSEEEEELLDLVPDATRFSRLACQIVLSEALDGLTVRVAA